MRLSVEGEPGPRARSSSSLGSSHSACACACACTCACACACACSKYSSAAPEFVQRCVDEAVRDGLGHEVRNGLLHEARVRHEQLVHESPLVQLAATQLQVRHLCGPRHRRSTGGGGGRGWGRSGATPQPLRPRPRRAVNVVSAVGRAVSSLGSGAVGGVDSSGAAGWSR